MNLLCGTLRGSNTPCLFEHVGLPLAYQCHAGTISLRRGRLRKREPSETIRLAAVGF